MRLLFTLVILINFINASNELLDKKKIVYMVPDMQIPFWSIMSKGISNSLENSFYQLDIYDAKNEAKIELENIVKAINNKVSAIIISPLNSSSCVTVLKLAKEANIPVVISDVGTDDGDYVSYISSDNYEGA